MNATKLHVSLAAAVKGPPGDAEPIPVILKVRQGPIARGEAKALAAFKPDRTYRLLNARALTATPDQIAALTDDPAVELIWPDLPVHTWLGNAVPLVQAPRVWDSGFTGKDVKVAVIDTGLDYEHPDFLDRMLSYRDFVEPEAPDAGDPKDPNGHGTHITGIAAGTGAASEERYRGVAPDARLIVARALDASGNGSTSQVMAAIEWAVEQGAQVINVSLGGAPFPSDGTDALSTLCNAAVGEGVVVCAAAGNLGPAKHTVGAPGAATDVITVGAAQTQSDLQSVRVASFSSRGPTGDGRVKPDLLFPGVSIVAPRSMGTHLGAPLNDAYTAVNGTSQATPMAAGTAALLLQANPRLTAEEIKARMMRGAHHLSNVEAIAQGTGLGDSYNTFVSALGTPIDRGETTPEEPPVEPAGCRPGVAARFLRR